MKKVILFLALIVVIIIVLTANVGSSENIKIGGISALTGAGSAIGEEERRGALLAIEGINKRGGVNGKQLELISEDLSIDKLSVASTIASKLIDIDNVVAIVGAQWDEPAAVILPIIEEAKVPMVGADNSDQLEVEVNYEYFFSTWYDNRVGIREILRYAQENEIKDIGIIKLLDGGFWEFTAQIMLDEAKNYGVNIVGVENLGNPLTLDFKSSILKMKQLNPDAVFIVTSDFSQCVFVKQMDELGLNIPSLGTESSGDLSSLNNCSQYLENRIFSTPIQTSGYREFAERFKMRFGDYPAFPSAANAYDAVMVIANGLEKTNGEGGEKLRDAIQQTKIEGVALENIQFNEQGFLHTPEDAFEIKTVKGGEFVKVE